MLTKQIFVSYSTQDTALAIEVRDGLESAGLACWMAPRDIAPGLEYGSQIVAAIEECAVLVLLLSESSNRSRFVLNEVERAVAKNKIVIPLRIHNVTPSRSLEFFISNAQWVDAWQIPLSTQLERLTAAIRRHLGLTDNAKPEDKPDTDRPPEPPIDLPVQMFEPNRHMVGLRNSLLVGRQHEWQTFQATWDTASSGHPHFIAISGEAGIGKSRLAEEMLDWARQQGIVTAHAHSYAAEGRLAYAPVIEWLHTEPLRTLLRQLDNTWLTEVARLLPELLAGRPELPRPEAITASWQRHHLFEALARAILVSKRSLLLVIDDLQWCDQETLEWLHFLLRYDVQARLLIVGTVRSGEISAEHPLNLLLLDLRKGRQLIEIELAPLTPSETVLLAQQIGGNHIASNQEAKVYSTTEGNPLFIVELMRAEFDRNSLALAQGEIASADPQANPTLPPHLQAVIQSRLVQLSPSARELARLAAAIGRKFTFDVLLRAGDDSEPKLVDALEELLQRYIIREQTTGSYDFSHGKIRDVVYSEVSGMRRRLLHRRVAQTLEAMYAIDAVSGEVATHYELAGVFDQAISHYQHAAEVAQHIYANSEAIQYYRRALSLFEGIAEPIQLSAVILYECLGETLQLISQYDEARNAYRLALARAPFSDRITQARLHRKSGNMWREEYRYIEACESYADAERVLGITPEVNAIEQGNAQLVAAWWEEWIQILLELYLVHYWLGQLHASIELRQKLQPAIERYGTASQRASFLQNVALLEFRHNRSVATEETVVAAKAALALLQEGKNQARLPSAHFLVGFVLLWSGDPQGSLEPLQIALTSAEESGDLSLQARCLAYMTIAQRQCKRIVETEQLAAHALAVAMATNMSEYIGLAKANQAWVAWQSGDLQPASEYGHAALAYWKQLPASYATVPFQWVAFWPLIAVAVQEGQISPAIDYVRRLLDPAQQPLPEALTDLLERAVQAWGKGETETVHRYLEESIVVAQQMCYL